MSSDSAIPDPDAQRMRPGDPYFNYCYWPYEPPTAGTGKLRPDALLFRAVQEMPHGQWVAQVIRALQRGLGDFRCVYGVKQIDGHWALEIYIYDYGRQDRTLSIERVVAASGGTISLPETATPDLPYFMFSFDLAPENAQADGTIEVVHVYIGNPGSTVSSGIAYAFTRHDRRLENFYFFFDATQPEFEQQIVDKMCCSVFSVGEDRIDELLRPELKSCHTICLANKQSCDTVYFSGVNIGQFLFFLKWQSYPEDFIRFVTDRREHLNHLLFDVGIDYRTDDDRLKIIKHGFYGVF